MQTGHSREFHRIPRTNSKNKRFNGTIQAEVLCFETFRNLPACQERFRDRH